MAGDLILSLGGIAVHTIDDLHRLLTAEAADQEAELVVLRRARIETLTVRAELEE
jgi:S1-C subfamily serine protease